MSETTTAVTVPVAPEAKKVAKKKTSKSKAKPVAQSQKKDVNKPQSYILRVLSKAKGAYTRAEIAEKAAKMGFPTSLGRIADEKGNYGHLVESGYVREDEVGKNGAKDDAVKRVYSITAKGVKALAAFLGK